MRPSSSRPVPRWQTALVAGAVLIAALGGAGCARTTHLRSTAASQAGFAEAERQLYPYRVADTVEGHRRLGALIIATRDKELRAAACYHYLRSSLDVAALAFYPIAAADGRPDRLLPIAQMIRQMPLDRRAAVICASVPRSLSNNSAWMPAWEALTQLVETLSAGRRGADAKQYQAALRRLATAPDGVGMRARFHLVGGCLQSYFNVYRTRAAGQPSFDGTAGTDRDPLSAFMRGCGYMEPSALVRPPKALLASAFDRMARDLSRSIGALPEDPFSAFAMHQLATVMAVRMQLSDLAETRQMARVEKTRPPAPAETAAPAPERGATAGLGRPLARAAGPELGRPLAHAAALSVLGF